MSEPERSGGQIQALDQSPRNVSGDGVALMNSVQVLLKGRTPMGKRFLRYWAAAGALLILTPSAANAESDEETRKAAFEAFKGRLVRTAEKETRLCYPQPEDSDPPRPKISDNLGEPPKDWSSVRIAGTGPDELRYLEAKIDEVAGTLKWIAVPDPPDPQFQWLLRRRCAEKSIDEQFCKGL
jgi:hypothetical protein